jgi:RNA polymerase sigma-70 factor (ECF subfamily)
VKLFFNKKPAFDKKDINSVITACLLGNHAAQTTLIKSFFDFAKSTCMRFAANEQECEEIMNDGFIKMFSNLNSFDKTQNFSAWLRTIMINTAIDYYRKSLKNPQVDEIETTDIPDNREDIMSKISAEEILALVQKLAPSYRMVFTLFVVEGYSHKEIAELLQIKEGTSKSNLQYARRRLQIMIKNLNPYLQFIYR